MSSIGVPPAFRLEPKGHNTFDVFRGFKHVGSVWHYERGWVAFTTQLRMVSGFWPSAEDAAEVLR